MQAAVFVDKDPDGNLYAGISVQGTDGVCVQFPVGTSETIDKNVDALVKSLRTVRTDLKRAASGIILPEGVHGNGEGNIRS